MSFVRSTIENVVECFREWRVMDDKYKDAILSLLLICTRTLEVSIRSEARVSSCGEGVERAGLIRRSEAPNDPLSFRTWQPLLK
jgi:hypothetical protein